jgi:hypothetical protein
MITIDLYLLHGLRKERWATVRKLNILAEAEKAVADGRVRHPGFSFHDEFEVFKDIIDSYDRSHTRTAHGASVWGMPHSPITESPVLAARLGGDSIQGQMQGEGAPLTENTVDSDIATMGAG